jgi:SAM-dependent methyltransferase
MTATSKRVVGLLIPHSSTLRRQTGVILSHSDLRGEAIQPEATQLLARETAAITVLVQELLTFRRDRVLPCLTPVTMRRMPNVSMPPEAASLPDPGEELILRVAGGPDRASFFWSGRESVRELERTLAIADRSLDSFESILDFGCGCGRMLLWLEQLGTKRALHGTDIDAEAIAWCKAHIPYARVSVNASEPPLPFPDGVFDLVFNHSVFTHIDEHRQDQWLTELQRVTRVGGLIVLSVHGEVALPPGASDIRDRLERDGIAFLHESLPKSFPLPDWYQTTFHAPWYVFEHWGRWFDIRAYVPGAALGLQDHVLLERRDDTTPPRRPLAARPRLAAEGVPETRVTLALTAARAYRDVDAPWPSRAAGLRTLAKRLVLRAIRPYSAHEDNFDNAVAASIAELTRAVDHHASALKELERSRFEDR